MVAVTVAAVVAVMVVVVVVVLAVPEDIYGPLATYGTYTVVENSGCGLYVLIAERKRAKEGRSQHERDFHYL